MLYTLIGTLYLLLPAGIANIFASISNKILPSWKYPLDMDLRLFGKRLLGGHKTCRGLLLGIMGGILGSFLQLYLSRYSIMNIITLIDYQRYNFVFLGFLLGTGAIFGDAVKSFVKRQFGIRPGKSFMPFDQIDWVLGASLFIVPVYLISLQQLIILSTGYFFIHITIRYFGYLMHLNKEKF